MPETVDLDGNVRILGEGRVVRIEINIRNSKNKIELLNKDNPKSPVVVKIVGDNGFYIRLFDHRVEAIQVFRSYGSATYQMKFTGIVPCLAGYRKKSDVQYIALADIGTPDMLDGGEKEALILTYSDIRDKSQYRVTQLAGEIHPALHKATKICLCEPRRLAREEGEEDVG